MALTTDVDDDAWYQITATAGQKIGVQIEPLQRNVIVYFLWAATDPGAEKLRPTEGDDALYQTSTSYGDDRKNGDGIVFSSPTETAHLWARSETGVVRVYASASV